VRILDLGFEDTLDAQLREYSPDVVGVTALTPEVYDAHLALDRVRELLPRALTVAGGIHASLAPEDFERPSVDVIVRGEGEITFRELIRAREAGTPMEAVRSIRLRRPDGSYLETPKREERVDLDRSPFARRGLLAGVRAKQRFFMKRPLTTLEASRGCPFRCSFCSVWKMHPGKCRYMSAERILAELETIEGPDTMFVDDNFLADVPRAEKLAGMIKSSGLKKTFSMQARSDTVAKNPRLIEKWAGVGLRGVLIGFETVSGDLLKKLNKANSLANNDEAIRILKANGIGIYGAFIVDPDFGVDDFRGLLDYVETRNVTYRQFTVLTPLPGTPFFEQVRSQLVTHDYRLYDCLHSVLPTRLSRGKFYEEFARLYRSYHVASLIENLFRSRMTVSDVWSFVPLLRKLTDPRAYLRSEAQT
jgi:radical SAM superfamily enzyme YgiQ (UPF0313 family)